MIRSVLNVIDRSANYMDLMFRIDPSVTQYRLLFARAINDAYDLTGGLGTNGVVGNLAPFQYPVDIPRGALYRSDLVVRRGLGRLDESTRGQTRVILDLSEFYGPLNPSVPADNQLTFVRVQEFNVATNAFDAPGPIHIIPPPQFYGNIPAGLTLSGTAPNTGIAAGDIPSEDAMWISLPRYCATSSLYNLDSAHDLLISWDYGQTSAMVQNANPLTLNNASYKNLLLESIGGNAKWTAFFSIVGPI
jgi:hypothetical protein